MSTPVRELFRELADVSQDERERILAQRHIPARLRAEVVSLLRHDSTSGASLARRVSDAAEEALRSSPAPVSRECGPYQLLRLLGSGGMGAVYLAERRDGEIEHRVAIKLLRADADRPEWRDRFLRERQLLAYLNHPSIARLLDAGHTPDGRPYLVMEHVDGVTIDEAAASLDLRAKLKLFLLVCDGVSHAHRRLIIHRDLKPSNILVDSSGQPKLLDFGIAKLLDVSPDETRTVERMLTPNYASPEQVRGEVQSTATDIYSLGAVLLKLLTGRSPRETDSAPVSGKSKLPRDIDHILRKAMRDEPDARYASADEFANDIRAFLDFRPVHARSGDAWYHARKFLRRYWALASAAAITITGLSIGLSLANTERARAEHRFQQVRQLANKVLALDSVVGALPGSTKARHEIVTISKEYLESLAPGSRDDQGLALEIGIAYARLAGVQGVPGPQNLGLYAQAEESLHRAEELIEPVLARSPQNRQSLLALCRINQGLMSLAGQNGGRRQDIVGRARNGVRYLDTLLSLGTPSEAELREGSKLLYSVALAHRNLHMHNDAIPYARRSTELARQLPGGEDNLADGLSLLADLTRIAGDLDGALAAIREARTTVERAHFSNERRRRDTWFKVLWREGVILGGGNGVCLNRPAEAIPALEGAFQVIEDWAQSDVSDTSVRILFDQAARELGIILRDRDPQRALQVYDHALRRLAEVKNSPRARRGEAGMLAGSSYALRRLNQVSEARNRIDAAFRLLRETKDYPAIGIDMDSEAEPALRALGDHLAEAGQPLRAAEVYQELLDKLWAAHPNPANDLRAAAKFSRIYGTLAILHRRNHHAEAAEAASQARRDLWNRWHEKLPGNTWVRRQLQAAGA